MNLRNFADQLVDIRRCSQEDFEQAVAVLAWDGAWRLIAQARQIRAKFIAGM